MQIKPTKIGAALLSIVIISALHSAVKGDEVDKYVQQESRKQHIPGLAVAVIQNGIVLKSKGYGFANVEQSSRATENTAFQLASVTKQFTATAIMMLIEEGKLNLEDKIVTLLPDLPKAWGEVRVRHLLNHTSGIKSYTSTKDFWKSIRKDFTHEEIIELSAKEPMEFAPGEKWNYNNTGYFLLGMIIEKASGKTYGEFMAERIFKPLSMTRTGVNDLHKVIQNRAQGYGWTGKEFRNGEYVSPSQPFSAGALISTVSDLVKWDAALASEKLIKKSVLERMWEATPLSRGGVQDYGFGWGVGKVNGHRLISHSGGIPGFSTDISRFVDDRLTVIVLTNSDSGNAESLAQGIARLTLPTLAQPMPPIVKVQETLLKSYLGKYDVEGKIVEITLVHGSIYFNDPNIGLQKLLPTSENTFFIADINVDPDRKKRFTFQLDSDGKPLFIVFKIDEQELGKAPYKGR